MSVREVQTENNSVHSRWQSFRKTLDRIVKEKGGEVKTCGVRYWDRPILLNNETATWSERAMFSKPSRWLFKYDLESEELVPSNKIAYFSLRNEALTFVTRAFVSIRSEEASTHSFPENAEWMVIFVADSLTPRGSSSAITQSSELSRGQLSITTDDRKFKIPLKCIGLISPTDRLHEPEIAKIDEAITRYLRQGVELYNLTNQQECDDFLSVIDSLALASSTQMGRVVEGSWVTAHDLEYCEDLFETGNSNLVLWGDESTALTAVCEHLELASEYQVIHYEALPDWNEDTLRLLSQRTDLAGKVVFVHGIERVNPDSVLPQIVPNLQSTTLLNRESEPLPGLDESPKAWVLVGNRLSSSQITKLHRTLKHGFKWFRCEGVIHASDAVRDIYLEEGAISATEAWLDNLFVIMWEEIRAHLPVSPETLATVVRCCLRQDLSATWDINASPKVKETMVKAIEAFLTPEFAAAPKDVRTRCVNSLIGSLDIPTSYCQRLLSLTLLN